MILFNLINMPFKTRRVKIQHQPEWFSASISFAIKQRNNLHRRAIRYNTELHWREYRLARNQVVHLIKVLYLTALIIDLFQFLLFSLRFLNIMFTFHFMTFSPKMTCSPVPSLASESLALASLLLLVLSIAF